jgi:hypothetical protein
MAIRQECVLIPAVPEQKMRRLIVATAFLSLAFPAQANDLVDPSLSLKSKVLAAAGAPSTKQAEAPFTIAHDPLPQLLMTEEQDRRTVRATCEAAARDLCFDASDGRIVYRGARNYMPRIEGLTPESVSVRSNRVMLKYSFR